MEIIKDVGEQPPHLRRRLAAELRPLLAVRGAGASLCAGSAVLLRAGWTYLGERLHGWERYGACAFGGYVAVYGCGHAPDVARFAVPGTVVVWCAAAWWAAPPADVEEPEPEPVEEPDLDARAAFVQWLLDLIGDRPGIHLRDLYPAMRQLPGCESHDNARLRTALTTLGIPVHRSLRIGVLAGRSGVRKTDLLSLPPLDEPESGEPDGDAGQPVDSPAGESPGEQMESA
jgi:hypothetical protein